MHVPGHHQSQGQEMGELWAVTVRVRRKTVELSPPPPPPPSLLIIVIRAFSQHSHGLNNRLSQCCCHGSGRSGATCCGIRWQSQSPRVSVSGKAILMQFSPLSPLSSRDIWGSLCFYKIFPPRTFLCSHIIIFRTEYCNYMFGPQLITSYLATLSLKWHIWSIFSDCPINHDGCWGLTKTVSWELSQI